MDSNDNAPKFLTQTPYEVYLNETKGVGEQILQLRAEDLDEGNNGQVRQQLQFLSQMTQTPQSHPRDKCWRIQQFLISFVTF